MAQRVRGHALGEAGRGSGRVELASAEVAEVPRLATRRGEQQPRVDPPAIAKHNRRGWRLDKPSLDTPNDSIIALCMALEALENQPEPVQVVGWL